MSDAEIPMGSVVVFPFPDAIEDAEYRVFPAELENDPLIAFHGTAEGSLRSIIEDGFEIKGSLPSCSFATGSPLALRYACDKRSDASPNGCVIAVRFRSFDDVAKEHSVIHVYRPDRMPEIIGYCVVPAAFDYR